MSSTPSLTAGGVDRFGQSHAVPTYSYRIVNTYPHDPNNWTQGLVFERGSLFESTGRHGESRLGQVNLESGEMVRFSALPERYYGEGMTILGDRIFQLTWRSHLGFVYDLETFEPLGAFAYPTEGWGITHDGENLIMSDGTANLHFLDPETFEKVGQITVHDGEEPVIRLNELEYIQGRIYANVWMTDLIAIIDPQTGLVTGWLDLGGLMLGKGSDEPLPYLNGIAYDAESDRLFVTGKLWPRLFQIELVSPD